jgi:hypothetical protein
MNLLTFALITNIFAYIPWTSIFLFTKFFKVRLYNIHRLEECQRIQKRVGIETSEIGDGGKGQGYAVGYWYFVHISSRSDDNMPVWMIATDESYKTLTQDFPYTCVSTIEEKEQPIVKIIQRTGSYIHYWFRNRSITLELTPRPFQQTIIDKSIENMKETSHTVMYLWGPPGTGKSMIALFLANQTKGIYCNTLRPWQPNDSIDSVYSEAEPTKENPLILVFDEFDYAITKIHEGIQDHKHLPIQVQNKAGWNRMLDEIQRGMFPHLYLILTSNKSPEYFNKLDPSYLREARVNLTFEVN